MKITFSFLWGKLVQRIVGGAHYNSKIDKKARIGSRSFIYDSEMGRFSYCRENCFIVNCEIGAFCSIANQVSIGGRAHPMDWLSTSPAFYKGAKWISKDIARLEYDEPKLRTYVGNDVWIGEKAIIKAGVTIGDGAVVGMGSVVTKNVPPYAIVAGNPAKVISKRFDDAKIEKLLTLKYWDIEEEALKNYVSPYVDDVDKAIGILEEMNEKTNSK